ncbi:MAG TPA: TonB-dependent receptor, partial [Rhodothermales bacterium]
MKVGNSIHFRVLLVALGCASSIASVSVQAQDALEEIVVTATRRTTDLQKAGISASVLSGDMIDDKAVFDLYELQYAAPSMTIASFGSANEFSIRGVGRTQVDIDVPSGVVIYRDGAPTIAGYFQTEPYFDVESIEVLRGPQGTFVGKNASGGAVFINTNDPSFDKFSANLEGGIGNNDMWEGSVIVNAPVNETLAVRGSYKHLGSNDFYDSITGATPTDHFTGNPGERNLNSYRGAVRWEPNNQFKAVVKVDYHDLDFGGNVVSSVGFPLYDVPQCCEFDYTDKSLRVVGDLKYTLTNGITFSSLSAYQHLDTVNNLDLNGSLPLFYQFKSNGTLEIVSQEFNVISAENQRLRWIVGGLYFEQNTELPYYDPVDHTGFAFIGNVFGVGIDNRDFAWFATPWFELQRDLSVFGQLAYDITDSLEIE